GRQGLTSKIANRNPFDILQIALQGDATGLSTGRSSYSIAVTANHTTPVTTTYNGSVDIINSHARPGNVAQGLLHHLPVEKHQGGARRRLVGQGAFLLQRQVIEEGADLRRAHFAWMAIVMEEDEATNPVSEGGNACRRVPLPLQDQADQV